MSDFQVLLTHPIALDFRLYTTWIHGHRLTHEGQANCAYFHTLHQHRLFSMMLHYLHQPTIFFQQNLFDLPPDIKLFLIEK
jgi:hypothetical protein